MKHCTCEICADAIANGGTPCEITNTLHWERKPDYLHPLDPARYSLTAPIKYAGEVESGNAIEITAGPNFNGSGPKAFGGAAQWPVLRVKVPFCVGREDQRDALVNAIADTINKFFCDNEPKKL